jgi:PIN domain nuclease of toxin-antitoxin system
VLTGSETLGAAARAALASSPSTASVANPWELVLKSCKPGRAGGRSAPLVGPIRDRAAHPALPIRVGHIRQLAGLPELYKDPFDRILAAQALAEGLTLASKDGLLAHYGSSWFGMRRGIPPFTYVSSSPPNLTVPRLPGRPAQWPLNLRATTRPNAGPVAASRSLGSDPLLPLVDGRRTHGH